MKVMTVGSFLIRVYERFLPAVEMTAGFFVVIPTEETTSNLSF